MCYCQSSDGAGRGAVKGALIGSMGEPIRATATGPRLSTEGLMRNSAEAYLKGSTEVVLLRNTIPF